MIYPQFKKDNAYVYKILSPSTFIQVYKNGFLDSCQLLYVDNSLIVSKLTESISEGEFLEAYYEVRKKLDELCLIQIDK